MRLDVLESGAKRLGDRSLPRPVVGTRGRPGSLIRIVRDAAEFERALGR